LKYAGQGMSCGQRGDLIESGGHTMKKKRAGILLKLLVAMLAVYAAVQMVMLQIEINTQRAYQEQQAEQKEKLQQQNAALRSFIDSEMDDQAIERIARDELGYVLPGERVIVDIGH